MVSGFFFVYVVLSESLDSYLFSEEVFFRGEHDVVLVKWLAVLQFVFYLYHSPAMTLLLFGWGCTKVKNIHVYEKFIASASNCTFFKKRKEEEDEKDITRIDLYNT